jgi:hypothetical protein
VPLHLGNFPITGYVVKIYLHGAADPFKVDNVGASTYEYTKSDLNVNQQYDFRVAATYGVDKKGAYAGPLTMTAGLLPDAPTLAQGSVDNQHIRITITDGAQTGSSAISQYNYKYR